MATARFVFESWWTCQSSAPGKTWRNRSDSVLATAHDLTVMPPWIRRKLDPDIYPVRGWRGQTPDWYGIPCRIGRVTVWLPHLDDPDGLPLRAYPLLALFPDRDLPDAPPFIHLGVQFLVEHGIRVTLDGAAPVGGPRSRDPKLTARGVPVRHRREAGRTPPPPVRTAAPPPGEVAIRLFLADFSRRPD